MERGKKSIINYRVEKDSLKIVVTKLEVYLGTKVNFVNVEVLKQRMLKRINWFIRKFKISNIRGINGVETKIKLIKRVLEI